METVGRLTASAEKGASEQARLEALERYDLHPGPTEEALDAIARVAALLLDTPMAFVTVVGRDRIWFKAAVGGAAGESAREFCVATVDAGADLVVPDASVDPRFATNPMVTGAAQVRFYAGAPVRTPEGHCIGTLCVLDTRPRTIDDAQREALGVLADQVAAQLASRRHSVETRHQKEQLEAVRINLEMSNRALVEAVSDLEAFCYSVSHDLRSPLRVINGFATMLHESAAVAADAGTHRVIARIRENTNRMSELLDDLLSFFRLGRRVIEVTHVDMNELVRETVTTLGLDTMRTEFSCGQLEPVEGDRALLADVIANLVTNAFKFSSRRPSPRVEVGCEGGDAEIVYYVRDNGVGFQGDHAARLFEPFQRLHAADGYEGTGVGLAIVRRILDRHGGRVWAESIPTRGSTFRFALPR